MTARLGLWLLLASAGWAFSFWLYRRRELRVPAHVALAALRGGSLALILLLLLDLSVPWGSSERRAWWLLDTSGSMSVAQGGDGSAPPLDRALGSLPEGVGALTFGAPAQLVTPGPEDPPRGLDSRLSPALIRALEAGASRITVVTDLRLEDPVEVAAALRDAPVPVTFVDVGGTVVNAGVTSLTLPEAANAGEEVQGEAQVFGEGVGSVRLSLEVAGELAWDTVLSLPGDRAVRAPIRFTAPETTGPVPVRARVTAQGDAYGGDDARTTVLEVDPATGELVLVSLEPDWEPRFLLPVLEEVTGLRGQGYLRVGADRYMTMTGPVRVLESAEVAAALEEARIGVAHGFDDASAVGFEQALRRVPRLLAIPTSASAAATGEWYVTAEVPSSPLAGELAGIPLLGLPPILGFSEATEAGGIPVLQVQRSARGDPAAAFLLREDGGRRAVEARAHGFWRWAFREGPPRQLYRRLWSGAAAWLLAGGGPPLREVGIGPGRVVTAPGDTVEWRAGPAAGGAMEVRYLLEDREDVDPGTSRTTVVDSLGRASAPAPTDPGVYRWEARVTAGPGEGREASGLMVVEGADLDLLHPRAVSLTERPGGDVEEGGAAGGRPLRTHPLPYLLLLGLLTAEWVGRRRSGLR